RARAVGVGLAERGALPERAQAGAAVGVGVAVGADHRAGALGLAAREQRHAVPGDRVVGELVEELARLQRPAVELARAGVAAGGLGLLARGGGAQVAGAAGGVHVARGRAYAAEALRVGGAVGVAVTVLAEL